MASQCVINNAGCVSEGTDIDVAYILKDSNGDPITSIDSLEYKLSDGNNVLTDWTSLPAVAPDGLIPIAGSKNIIQGRGLSDRVCTLHSIKNGKSTFQPIKYSITDDPNVTKDSP
ncbi:hypothetical protein KAR91_30900 [Candidatus Pacearchaeota archaeon]|nr:hypothetical protein [Candidatus Pacearchaeota archaeon]